MISLFKIAEWWCESVQRANMNDNPGSFFSKQRVVFVKGKPVQMIVEQIGEGNKYFHNLGWYRDKKSSLLENQ